MKKYSWGIRFSDILITSISPEQKECVFEERDHALIYVRQGDMEITGDGIGRHIRSGECAFVRRDYRVMIHKKSLEDKPFLSTTLLFKRKFLVKKFYSLDRRDIPKDAKRQKMGVVKIPIRTDLKNLFDSIQPYVNSGIEPSEEWINSKLTEGLNALLFISPTFYASLFDFTEPWKIDLMDFVNSHLKDDLSLKDIALFTGRSLATLKRDFSKISDISLAKWIVKKRLYMAKELLESGSSGVSQVMCEVGFKNLSHFSKAYKKEFGFSPSKTMKHK